MQEFIIRAVLFKGCLDTCIHRIESVHQTRTPVRRRRTLVHDLSNFRGLCRVYALYTLRNPGEHSGGDPGTLPTAVILHKGWGTFQIRSLPRTVTGP